MSDQDKIRELEGKVKELTERLAKAEKDRDEWQQLYRTRCALLASALKGIRAEFERLRAVAPSMKDMIYLDGVLAVVTPRVETALSSSSPALDRMKAMESEYESDIKAIIDLDVWRREELDSCSNLVELSKMHKETDAAIESAKNTAYSERNKLVAALSKLFPSWLEDHDTTDKAWENDWRNIVFIDLPTGQASWHIHDSELQNFAHLSRLCGNSWDGHTTEEKYKRLASLAPNEPTK